MGVLSQIGSRGQTVYSFGADSLALVPNCSGPRCLGPNCLGLILPGAHWITTGCWQIGPGQSGPNVELWPVNFEFWMDFHFGGWVVGVSEWVDPDF